MADAVTKHKNIPELRFARFKEEWARKELGDISEKVTEKNEDGLHSETFTNSAEHGIVSQRDFFDKDISNQQNLKSYYVVRNDDFIYNPRISEFAPVGPIRRNKLNRTGVMSPIYYVFRTFDIDKRYLENYFLTDKWHKFMIKNGNSGARSDRFSINDAVFNKMNIPYPAIEEQQKIGDFFSKLDRRIELEEKKLNLLEEQKKGYMQKIFSQELRFKDENGNYYPEWTKRMLTDVADIKTGNKNVQDNIPNGKYAFFDRSVEKKYLNEYEFDEEAIIYPGEGSEFLPEYFNGKYSLHQRAYSIYNIRDIYPLYLNYYLMTQNKHFLRFAVGSTVKSLRMDTFYKLEVIYPIFEEQQKIAEFFQKLDRYINMQNQKLNALKIQKQGFLQKMFI